MTDMTLMAPQHWWHGIITGIKITVLLWVLAEAKGGHQTVIVYPILLYDLCKYQHNVAIIAGPMG